MFSGNLPNPLKRGDPIPAAWLNEIRDMILQSVIGGPNVRVTSLGRRVVIEVDETQIVPKT